MCSSCSDPTHTHRSLSRRLLLGGVAAGAGLATVPAGIASAATDSRGGSDLTRGLHVVLLGTAGGPPPRPGQAGISTAIVVDGKVYLVDVGAAAVHQFVNAGLQLADLTAVFVTHLHVDHLADYPNLFLLGGWNTPGQGDTLAGPIPVYGPGAAGGLPPAFGNGTVSTTSPGDPTPGLAGLTDHVCDAFAYSTNVFMRDSGIRETRALADVHEIDVAGTGASYENTAPDMRPFVVMEDDRVRVTAVLVPHGPAFPAFAYRFDTAYGSVTFSGDTTYSENLERLADGSRLLVHEAVNVQGMSMPAAVLDHILLSHVEVQKVGGVATRSNAEALLLSHIGNLDGSAVNRPQWRRWARNGYDGPVHVGGDLEIYSVDRKGVKKRS
ncbi:MBL fold metallo-hydrolase [Streptomyces sp. NPDC052052]|uniref:MBL fold metallo-hydrolase n=1 Tax=Streptomyces sp. NPDC052052 TaxID=3154756 RepID=UPI00341ADB41